MTPTAEHRAYALYDQIIRLLALIDLADRETQDLLHGKLTEAAVRHDDSDQLALHIARQIVEVYRDTNQ